MQRIRGAPEKEERKAVWVAKKKNRWKQRNNRRLPRKPVRSIRNRRMLVGPECMTDQQQKASHTSDSTVYMCCACVQCVTGSIYEEGEDS